ncbi:tyrosine-type recombinase/integrase [Burkholderia sp. PR2]|uniref:tyrosine-type recombinase/integrase n=1 Tax=Burkholderia sp. PR2 TaxID=3448078 RepID=UPI00402AC802
MHEYFLGKAVFGGHVNNLYVFNNLQNLRYSVTYTHNVTVTSWRQDRATNDADMNLTYKELIQHHKSRLSDDTPAAAGTSQTFKNQLSTLHSYLSFSGKTVDAWVGLELLGEYETRVKDYLASIDVASRTKSDRRSHLKAWRRTAEIVVATKQQKIRGQAARAPGDTEFHRVLRGAFAARTESSMSIARKAGADEQAVKRWLKGGIPNQRAYPSLRRLERELGLQADALRQLVPKQRQAKVSAPPQATPPEIPYRTRLRGNIRDEYRLKHEQFGPAFADQWQAFFDYKTSRLPKLARADKGVWRLLPRSKGANALSKWAIKGESGCETAQACFEQVRSYFGFLVRPQATGGLGLPVDQVQTLGWLAVPDAVNAFLEFLTDRSGGTVHGGHQKFCALVCSLTRADTGFLAQQPHMASGLPTCYAIREWRESCRDVYKLCREWKRQATEKSRDPLDPIRPLLDLAEPFGPVLRAVADLDAAAAAAPAGSLEEALHKRDALLLSMLMANPLRRRNYIQMTWNDVNTGNLYRRQDGQWRLRFSAGDFKNEKRSQKSPYDAPLPKALAERIDAYIAEYRPRLVRHSPDSQRVFPNRTGDDWKALGRQVEELTRRLIPETLGFGPHGFRHLVATDYLRKNPNDYPTVALLLHDKLETVLAEYAHLRQDDSFGRYEQHLLQIDGALSSK